MQLDSEVAKLFEVIDMIRKYKTDNTIKYGQESQSVTISWTQEHIAVLKKYSNDIKSITRCKEVNFTEAQELAVLITSL